MTRAAGSSVAGECLVKKQILALRDEIRRLRRLVHEYVSAAVRIVENQIRGERSECNDVADAVDRRRVAPGVGLDAGSGDALPARARPQLAAHHDAILFIFIS